MRGQGNLLLLLFLKEGKGIRSGIFERSDLVSLMFSKL